MHNLHYKIYFLLIFLFLIIRPSIILSLESEIYNTDIDYEGAKESYVKLDDDKTYTIGGNVFTFKNESTVYFYERKGPIKIGKTAMETIVKIKNYEIIVDRNSTFYF